MAEMSDEEALKILTRGMEGGLYEDIGKAFCRAMNALAGSVAREREAKKPKRPSLKELEKHVRTSCADWKFVERDGTYLNHAADILCALDEKVVPLLKARACCGSKDSIDMLRALGEEVP